MGIPRGTTGVTIGRTVKPRVPPAKKKLFLATKSKPTGMLIRGNIDLNTRPSVLNSDGTTSSVRSKSFEMFGREVLVPTVIGNSVVSDEEAWEHFKKTGKHLGIFDTPDNATSYATALHEEQAARKTGDLSPSARASFERAGRINQQVPTLTNMTPEQIKRAKAYELVHGAEIEKDLLKKSAEQAFPDEVSETMSLNPLNALNQVPHLKANLENLGAAAIYSFPALGRLAAHGAKDAYNAFGHPTGLLNNDGSLKDALLDPMGGEKSLLAHDLIDIAKQTGKGFADPDMILTNIMTTFAGGTGAVAAVGRLS